MLLGIAEDSYKGLGRGWIKKEQVQEKDLVACSPFFLATYSMWELRVGLLVLCNKSRSSFLAVLGRVIPKLL